MPCDREMGGKFWSWDSLVVVEWLLTVSSVFSCLDLVVGLVLGTYDVGPNITNARKPEEARLRTQVYRELMEHWLREEVGRARRPNPNVRLAHVKVYKLSEGLRERVTEEASVARERNNAQRRARRHPDRAAEAAEERAERRRAREKQREPRPTAAGTLADARDHLMAVFAPWSTVGMDLAELASDLAVRLLLERGVPRHGYWSTQMQEIANRLPVSLENMAAVLDALPIE